MELEIFDIFIETLRKEQNKLTLKQKKQIANVTCAPYLTLSKNFASPVNRCSYMYRYSTCFTFFIKTCISKFLWECPGAIDLLSSWRSLPDSGLCSLSCGPGIDYFAFNLAVWEAEQSPHIFNTVHIISKNGAWRHIVNFLAESVSQFKWESFAGTKDLNFMNIKVQQGDIFKVISRKMIPILLKSNAVLMFKTLNYADSLSDDLESSFQSSLTVLISKILRPGTTIFFIDTKESLSLMEKTLKYLPGKYLYGPIHLTHKLCEPFSNLWKKTFSVLPDISAQGAFFVWQKSSDISSLNSANTPKCIQSVNLHIGNHISNGTAESPIASSEAPSLDSSPLILIDTARTYSTGDLIFAKMPGYPPWPARIEPPIPGQKFSPNEYPVFFFGTYRTIIVQTKDIFPYEKFKHMYGKPREGRFIKEALFEINNYATGFSFLQNDPTVPSVMQEKTIDNEETEKEYPIASSGVPSLDSSRLILMDTARTYSPFDLIFAKIPGSPPWPARIEPPIPGQEFSPNKYPVFFFGTHRTIFVQTKDIFPYEKFKHMYSKSQELRFFKEALLEISNYVTDFSFLQKDPTDPSVMQEKASDNVVTEKRDAEETQFYYNSKIGGSHSPDSENVRKETEDSSSVYPVEAYSFDKEAGFNKVCSGEEMEKPRDVANPRPKKIRKEGNSVEESKNDMSQNQNCSDEGMDLTEYLRSYNENIYKSFKHSSKCLLLKNSTCLPFKKSVKENSNQKKQLISKQVFSKLIQSNNLPEIFSQNILGMTRARSSNPVNGEKLDYLAGDSNSKEAPLEKYAHLGLSSKSSSGNLSFRSTLAHQYNKLVISSIQEEKALRRKRKMCIDGTEYLQKNRMFQKETLTSDPVQFALLTVERMRTTNSYSNPDERLLVNALINPKYIPDTKTLLFRIFQFLNARKVERLAIYLVQNSPSILLPVDENCIVSALFKIEEKHKVYLDKLLVTAVNTLHQIILAKESFCLPSLSSLCRVFTEICKRKNMYQRPIFLCLDLLKVKHKFTPCLIASIAGVWKELFEVSNDITDESKALLCAISYGVTRKKPKFLNIQDWERSVTFLSKIFIIPEICYVQETVEFLIKKVHESCTDGLLSDIEYSLIAPLVICALHADWSWAQEHVLDKHIIPGLTHYSQLNQMMGFNVFCNIYASIFSFCPGRPQDKILTEYFEEKCNFKAQRFIRDSAAVYLIKIAILRKKTIPDTLINWYKTNEENPLTLPFKTLFHLRQITQRKELTQEDILQNLFDFQ